MQLFNWLKGRLSHRSQAMWLYRQGMLKAKLRDHASAVAAYTTVIDMADAPEALRAMALYNRSLVYLAGDNEGEAKSDLERLLEMAGAAANVKTEARRKLLRMQRTSDRIDERARDREV